MRGIHVPGRDVVFEVLAHHKCIQLHNDLLWSLLLLVVRMSFYLFFLTRDEHQADTFSGLLQCCVLK